MNRYQPVKQGNGPRAGQLLQHESDPKRWLVKAFIGRDVKGRKRYRSRVVRGARREAEAVLLELLQQKSVGGLTPRSTKSLAQLAEDWVAHKAGSVSPRTLAGYWEALQRYVLPSIGHRKLADITLHEIDLLYGQLMAGTAPRPEGPHRVSGRPVGPRTVRLAHSALSQALSQAVKWRWLPHNPAAGATIPPLRTKERSNLSLQERARFIEACRSSFYGSFYRLLVDTGMRPGEACGLKWSDVDFARATVDIQRAVTRGAGGKVVLAEPKTSKSRRTIPLTRDLQDELLRHRDYQRAHGLDESGFVFTNTCGGILRPWTFSKRDLKQTVERAGITAPITLYSLRHTFASLHLVAGTPLKIVSAMLGHSNISQTADTYMHADGLVTAEWMQKYQQALAADATEVRPPLN